MKKYINYLLKTFMSEQSVVNVRRLWASIKMDLRHKFLSLRPTTPPPYKLHIGCGTNIKPGWINIDLLPPANFIFDVRRGIKLPGGSCEIIYSEHFLEHLSFPDESIPFLKECFRLLQNDGLIHVGVPDDQSVIESCLSQPINPVFLEGIKNSCEINNCELPDYLETGFEYINFCFRSWGHKYAYDLCTLKHHLEMAGFSDVERRPFNNSLDSIDRKGSTLYVTAKKSV